MIGRAMVLAGLLGVVAAHGLADLPSPRVLSGATLALGLGLWGARQLAHRMALRVAAAGIVTAVAGLDVRGTPMNLRHRLIGVGLRLGACLLAGWAAFAVTALWAQARLDQTLLAGNVDRVARVLLRIDGLPRLQVDRVSFEARVLGAHPGGVPEHLLVSWPAPGWRGPYAQPQPADPPFPELRAGQIWRMALVLRPVRSARNLHGFDYEGHAFAAGIRALGTVRGTPEHVRDEDWGSLSVVAGRARHAVREAMAPHLQGRRYGPVLRALAIGDQDGVDDADWTVFNRTGITHLVSISGSHITMLAGVGAVLVSWLWRRLRWRGRCLAERWPARRAAACAALIVAWLYCLLAGWGVPARRTFLMLAVVAGAQALQLRLNGARVLALAAVVVLAMDPWAVLASGFWLSFVAVAVLLAVGASAPQPTGHGQADGPAPHRRERWLQGLRLAARLQWAVTLALAPALAWVFHEVSLVSPFANAYAIPLIELVVTPLSLLLAAAALTPGLEPVAAGLAWLAHGILNAMMQPTEWLARLPTLPVAAGPAGLYLLAAAGAAVALWPHGRPQRAWAWLAMLPMVLWPPARPALGEWDLYALDVGQGSAVLLRTAAHTLLFDAGARHARGVDEGARTLVPALRALGIRRLDALVVSHADLDHAGGVRSLLASLPIMQAYSSFALQPWLQREARKLDADPVPAPLAATPCQFGGRWRIDGVSFEFLWPLDVRAVRRGAASNAGSCVLRVRGAHHSVLLTGDIEGAAEAALVERGLNAVDVVVAAHHGSRSSSSAAFVDATAAHHVIIQAGRWNRHGHPAPAVLARWSGAGAQIWRTDWQGGINAHSRAGGLSLYSVHESSRRYWHGRRP